MPVAPVVSTRCRQEPLISLQKVSKAYPIAISGSQKLSSFWALLMGREPTLTYQAISDVTMNVWRGESMALVGVNGAGKSTLLKMIAGVVRPSGGSLHIKGRVGALLELGAGFHPEYTGRQNIHLACALMGLSARDAASRVPEIIAFADIGAHIEQPVKHYSSGMIVRLGFAIATTMAPDVLITDEVLAVGDESFQKKCTAWMESYLSSGGTLLLCSHSMFHVQKLCAKAAWIHEGRVRIIGSSADVTREYLAWHEERGAAEQPTPSARVSLPDSSGTYHVRTMALNETEHDSGTTVLKSGRLLVTGTLYSPDDRAPGVAIGIVRADGTSIYGTLSEFDGFDLQRIAPNLYGYALEFPDLPLLPGRYIARSHAMDPEGMRLYDHVDRKFDVIGESRELGFCRLTHKWIAPI